VFLRLARPAELGGSFTFDGDAWAQMMIDAMP